MAWQSLFMSPCLPLSAPTPPSDATAAAILFLQQNALPALGGHSRSTSPEHHPSPSPFRCCCASIASELPRVHAIMASPFRLQLTVSLVALVVAMASSAMGIGVLKSTYNASTELDGSAATLHWTLSPSTIQLALVVKAPSVVTTNASALWVGFGIGDPQSGGMVGAGRGEGHREPLAGGGDILAPVGVDFAREIDVQFHGCAPFAAHPTSWRGGG